MPIMSGQAPRDNDLSRWPLLTHATHEVVSPSEFLSFANTYGLSEEFPFTPRNSAARTIDTNDYVLPWTYFHAYCPGLQANVPIPLHPDLQKTPFYCQMSYLLRACTAFTHIPGLEDLTDTKLNESYVSRGLLLRDIRRALGGGRSVLVRECTTQFSGVPIDVTEEAFSRLTLDPHSHVEAQDMANWPGRVTVTMREFWEHRSNPLNILNLLDLNCHLDAGRSAWMTGLYDDVAARRTVESELPFTVADLNRYPQWLLYGHPFAHTFLHHDATGVSTYATVVSGRKLWFLLRWTVDEVTPEHWYHRWRCLSTHDYLALEYEKRPLWIHGSGAHATVNQIQYNAHCEEWEPNRIARWECAELGPGTMLIMPPEQPHIVYKPEMSLASGGHGLLWNTLQLTEIGCRMDSLSPSISNDIHSSMLLIHMAMALSLPNNPEDALDSGRTQGELESIVRLVLAYPLYRQARHELEPGESADQRYNKVDAPQLERQARKLMQIYQNHFAMQLPTTPSPPEPTATEFSWAKFQPLT